MHPRIHAQDRPGHPALIDASNGQVVSYGELEQRANRAAHALRELGAAAGSAVILLCDNRPEFFDIFWSAQRSGVLLVPTSTRLTPGEVEYIVNDSGASLVLVSDRLPELAHGLEARRAEMPGLDTIATIGPVADFADWNAVASSQSASPIPNESAGGRMAYSSGTTGRPKGIRPSPAEGPVIQPHALAHLFIPLYGLDAQTVYLSPAPLYHSAPMGWTTAVQSSGGTVVMMDKFQPQAFLAAVEQYRVTHTQVVPTMFSRLLALPPQDQQRHDLSSLKAVIHAAAPCPVPVKQAMIDWLGPVIEEYYSGTEGAGFTAISCAEWLEHPGSVGKSLSGAIHICDDDGHELPVGETGAIYFETVRPFVYHNDPEKTARARNPLNPNWSTFGDVGRVDDDGYLYLSDRKDFMIISGGVNVYPQEVENLLITHPEIEDAAVFGVPHADFGEEVKAVVQPRDWARATPEFAAELLAYCRAQLADVKCPRSVDFEPQLPRTETGKLFKKELKARYWPAG